MAGFRNLRALVDRQVTDGAEIFTVWRKAPAVVTAQGFWQDLSMAPGNPKPNYYASSPLISASLSQSSDGGIFHGGAVSPGNKYLRKLSALTVTAGAVPLPMILCDYLLYYPFVDEGTTDVQTMTVGDSLPRYTDGAGVQMMAVVVAGHATGGATFSVSYTNQSGVAGRTSATVKMGTQFVNGTILTTAQATAQCYGPFIPLQSGDTGVRSVESVTVNAPGDVGLFTLVLVKPLADISLRGIDAPVEVDYLKDRPSMPKIEDNAYLNFICCCAGSLSGASILGEALFTWTG